MSQTTTPSNGGGARVLRDPPGERHAAGLRARGADVKRYRKPTFTKPAPVDLRHQIAVECDAVVEALAD